MRETAARHPMWRDNLNERRIASFMDAPEPAVVASPECSHLDRRAAARRDADRAVVHRSSPNIGRLNLYWFTRPVARFQFS